MSALGAESDVPESAYSQLQAPGDAVIEVRRGWDAASGPTGMGSSGGRRRRHVVAALHEVATSAMQGRVNIICRAFRSSNRQR